MKSVLLAMGAVLAVGATSRRGSRARPRPRRNAICHTTFSTAWIDPKGELFPLEGGEGHGGWAKRRGEGRRDALVERGWIKVSSWKEVQVGAVRLPMEARNTYAGLVVCCAVHEGIDPERTEVRIWEDGRPKQVSVADLIDHWGTPDHIEQLYSGLSGSRSRRGARNAAVDPLEAQLRAAGLPAAYRVNIEATDDSYRVILNLKENGVSAYFRASEAGNDFAWAPSKATRWAASAPASECLLDYRLAQADDARITEVWVVRGAELFDKALRGKGLGRVVYRAMMRWASKNSGVLGPHYCVSGGSTSDQARKAWASLPGASSGPFRWFPDLLPGAGSRSRRLGRSLPETGYALSTVTIYRGVVATVDGFKPKDYVTRNRGWARGHADHVAAVDEEDAVVLKARVKASDVYEASNPGEYFYDGPAVPGRVVYRAAAFSWGNE